MASQGSTTFKTATALLSVPPITTRRAGPRIAPDRASYKWWVAATVTLSAFLVVMNNATVNVALPQMMTAFSLNLDEAQWVITAYMIAGVTLVPTIGWLGSRVGNRTVFLVSLGAFVVSSGLCGLAWNGPSLVIFRVLQGLGGGPITPMAMVFLVSVFPAHQRGLAMGLYGMGMSFGPALGPVLGGYVTEYLNWRMVFFMNVVPGILCLALVFLVIPKVQETVRRSLDLAGLVTLVVFLVSLLVALSQGHREGWDAPSIQRLFVLAGVAFVAFVMLELSRHEPLVDLRLYKNVAFTIISVAVLLNSMCGWGSGFLQTILLQRLLDYTPAQAGFVILPGALGMACTTLLAGRLTDKLDRRFVVLCGLGLFIVTSYWFSFLTLDKPVSWVLWMTAWRYMSMGLLFTPMNTAALATLPPEKVRMGSGLITIVQQGLGGTMSIAGLTTILQHRVAYHAAMLDQQQARSVLGMGELLAPVRDLASRAGAIGAALDAQALEALRHYLEQQATVAAYQDCFLLLAALGVIMVPLVCFLRR